MIKFNIKSLRDKHNMSQKELIEKTGIRSGTMSSFENSNTVSITIEQLDSLCEAFNCQPSDIMTYVPNDNSVAALWHKQQTLATNLNKQIKGINRGFKDLNKKLNNK